MTYLITITMKRKMHLSPADYEDCQTEDEMIKIATEYFRDDSMDEFADGASIDIKIEKAS